MTQIIFLSPYARNIVMKSFTRLGHFLLSTLLFDMGAMTLRVCGAAKSSLMARLFSSGDDADMADNVFGGGW
jgi:hypothetical protein